MMPKSPNQPPVDPKIDLTRLPQEKGKDMPLGSEKHNPQSPK